MGDQQDETKSSQKVAKKRISVTLTEPYLESLDQLVEGGVYVTQGEAVKDALRRLFRHYEMEPFMTPLEETEGDEGENLSQEELVKRIAALKESEARIRAERQELERQLRDMICERTLIRGVKG